MHSLCVSTSHVSHRRGGAGPAAASSKDVSTRYSARGIISEKIITSESRAPLTES